jgi:hypothetical protein
LHLFQLRYWCADSLAAGTGPASRRSVNIIHIEITSWHDMHVP